MMNSLTTKTQQDSSPVPETPRFTSTEEANLIGYGEGYDAGHADGLRRLTEVLAEIYAACLIGDVYSIPDHILEALNPWGLNGTLSTQVKRLVEKREQLLDDSELANLRRQYADLCDRVLRAEAVLEPFAMAYRALQMHMAGAASAGLYAGFSSSHIVTMPTEADGSGMLGAVHLKAAYDLLVAQGVIDKAVAE